MLFDRTMPRSKLRCLRPFFEEARRRFNVDEP
jgi:hypothetical protein